MVTSMLEKAIEIEGLLRIIRDGNPLPETYTLLNIKASELASQAERLEGQSGMPEPATTHADFVMATPSPQQAPLIMQAEQTSPSEEEELDLSEEDDILLSFEDTTEAYFPTDEPAAEPEQEVAFGEPATDESLSFEIKTEVPATTEDPESPAETPKHVDMEAAQPQVTRGSHIESNEPKSTSSQAKRTNKLKSSFSLNDRFLYARELFNGNMKMFDSTLDFLDGVDDYSVIEDYFYSELEWDSENQYVVAFMDILRPHFKE